MAVSVHVAPHPDALVARLCDTLAEPPDDPFSPELIAVPTRGIERWLTQRIASELAARGIGDGIAANIEFPSPRQLVREVLLAVPELAASVEAWQTDQLTSHILAAIDAHSQAPWLRLIERYIEADEANRLAAATKIARLFATYGRRRPEMIRAWALGDDTGPDGPPSPPVMLGNQGYGGSSGDRSVSPRWPSCCLQDSNQSAPAMYSSTCPSASPSTDSPPPIRSTSRSSPPSASKGT